MRILVTNDDGIFADGIYKLAKELSRYYDVKVIAPDRQRSGVGHAITMHYPLRAKKVKFFDTDIEAWSINGTPSDCVKLGIEALLKEKPDYIISGINDGPNLGTDVIYSGTVSAAVEGSIHGIRSIAISLAGFRDLDYDYSSRFCLAFLNELKDKDTPKDLLLNINIPNVNEKMIKGVKFTVLGTVKYSNAFIKRQDPRGNEYYWMGGEAIIENQKEESDILAIKNNYVSITPIHYDLTNYKLFEQLRNHSFNI